MSQDKPELNDIWANKKTWVGNTTYVLITKVITSVSEDGTIIEVNYRTMGEGVYASYSRVLFSDFKKEFIFVYDLERKVEIIKKHSRLDDIE